jgi:hypothetical protein
MTPSPTTDGVPVEHVVAALRERMYGAISCLATLAALARYTDVDTNAWYRVIDVAVAAGGLWAAALLAEFIARLSVEGKAPRGHSAWAMLASSGQILQAAAAPAVILALAGFGVLDTPDAVWIAMWFLVAEMALIAFAAGHRAGLVWWQQIVAVLLLAGAGAAVVAVKMIAHH